jgi:hypothetical protein
MTEQPHHHLTDRLHRHHTPADDVTEAEESAAFDLGVDVSQPHPHSDAPAFDADRDLAFGDE